MFRKSSILIFSCLGFIFAHAQQVFQLVSPNGKNKVKVEQDAAGKLKYSVEFKGKEIIKPSALGFNFFGEQPIGANLQVVNSEKRSFDENWNIPLGEFSTIRNHYNELKLELKETSNQPRLVNLEFRAFDDGVGFRYLFPKQENLRNVRIKDEKTEFAINGDIDVWWIPVHRENSYYESLYRKTPISKTDTINTPATFETKDGNFFAIHEANLTDFASMTLKRENGSVYKGELVPWSDGVKVYTTAPFNTPWRIIITGEKAGDLATSTMMLNLNEPSKIADESWLQPSKYIGIWWGMHLETFSWGQGSKHGATTANTKRYIDFAAKHGLDGVLVEGWNEGWDGDWTADGNSFSFTKAYPDFDIKAITDYARDKKVRLIGHHETAGATRGYESQMEDAFRLYQSLGVNSVKTGYVNKYLDKKEWHDGQYGVRHYRKVVETAAKYGIMINNHEPVKGTGLQRTYPNLVSQEGGRGQEYDAWSADGGNPPEHTTIMPFTRMLSGPFDFTPGTFDLSYKVPSGARVQTTLAKQLALYVVMYSPIQMASDLPENYEGKPEFEFVKEVPAIWADTKFLDSKIGEYTTVVRKDRKSDDWYLGSITNKDARKLKVSLSFLPKNKSYKAVIYQDGKGADYKSNPYPVEITTKKVNSKTVLDINLAPGGGTVIKFESL